MKMFRPSVAAIATLGMLFSATQAFAGPHLDVFAPNGVSPWYWTETWYVVQGYGTGLHTDQYTDYYALDLVPGSGSACGKPVYPMFDGMRVDYTGSGYGRIDLTVTIGGVQYKTKYLHLSSFNGKKVGDIVGTNDVIGYTSNVATTDCHLHMNVQKNVSGTWYGIKPKICNTTYSYNGQAFPGC